MVFGAYADYYDFFYKNKNYTAECRFIGGLFGRYAKRRVRHVLDLGCGTGGHALALAAMGLQVTGVDASKRMLSLAQAKAQTVQLSLSLVRAKLQAFDLAQRFDAVICMFSVIDYLTKDEDLIGMLTRVRRHLKPGGIFICDFWHAPAVAAFTPHKTAIFTQGGVTVERASRTRLLPKMRCCEVRYNCTVKDKGCLQQEIKEVHRMRYFDIQEMKKFLALAGLKSVAVGPFLDIDKPVRKNTWDVAMVATRKGR